MKKERHRIVPASYLFLIKDNKILLSRRFNTGYEDGKYSLVAGHCEGNEPPLLTIIKETKEEVGITIKPEDLNVVHIMYRKGPGGVENERIDFFILAKKWEGEPKNMEPDKCDDIKWFPLNDLPENTLDCVKHAINCYQKGIFYSEYEWE
jgi:8-oxo-dGTP diphosphatase